jgi:hypothetical protein
MTKEKARRAVVNGIEHTDTSLTAMKTVEVAALIATIRGDGRTPRPATKAKAIELFWKAAETLPKVPEVREAKADASGAKKPPKKAQKDDSEKPPSVKRYAIRGELNTKQTAACQKFEPAVKKFVESMRSAVRPLAMVERAELLSKVSKTGNPAKHCSWIFCRRLRPAGILVESRADRGA